VEATRSNRVGRAISPPPRGDAAAIAPTSLPEYRNCYVSVISALHFADTGLRLSATVCALADIRSFGRMAPLMLALLDCVAAIGIEGEKHQGELGQLLLEPVR
jgi:hypothetical protein